jgi:hypothetical protein
MDMDKKVKAKQQLKDAASMDGQEEDDESSENPDKRLAM